MFVCYVRSCITYILERTWCVRFLSCLVSCMFYVVHVECIRFYSPVKMLFMFCFCILRISGLLRSKERQMRTNISEQLIDAIVKGIRLDLQVIQKRR
jgi:hypothetical protein